MARKWLKGASKRSRGGLKAFRGASKADRGWLEGLEGESRVNRGSGIEGETGLEPRQASGGDSRVEIDSKLRSFLSRAREVLKVGRLTLKGDAGALELARSSWVASESTWDEARGWAGLKLEGGGGTCSNSLSGPQAQAQESSRARRKKQKVNLRGCTRHLDASRMRGDGSLEPTYSRRGDIPLDALERDSYEAGGVFDIEMEASRSRNEVPWGGSRGEGGFNRVMRGEEGFEEVFEGLSRRDERLEGGIEGLLGRRRVTSLPMRGTPTWRNRVPRACMSDSERGRAAQIRGAALKGECEGGFVLELPWECLLEEDRDNSTGELDL
ncbi:hypothetical protein EDD15DRAFT_2520668 [Pisolithus albus]|nr:hypothetical protein EDD15DRAFT_2520668 [Pisolithus albus]